MATNVCLMKESFAQQTVTVSVITYNSSKYVVETLESIKAQTWKNIILQISDDCSTDATVEICRKWTDANKSRFVETRILTVEHNTGVSANMNRAWDACTTEYNKDIAGDDLLLPHCIEDNMEYISEHPEAVFVFSRATVFGMSRKQCEHYEKMAFDYSFFQMTAEQQYERIKYGCCFPAAATFCNLNRIREIGLHHDERIPFLEDRPKWITAIRKGIKFHFLDKDTVAYRLHNSSLSNSKVVSPKFYESKRLCYYYYVFPPMYETGSEIAIRDAIQQEMLMYYKYIDSLKQRDRIYNNLIIKFLRFLKRSFVPKR